MKYIVPSSNMKAKYQNHYQVFEINIKKGSNCFKKNCTKFNFN